MTFLVIQLRFSVTIRVRVTGKWY